MCVCCVCVCVCVCVYVCVHILLDIFVNKYCYIIAIYHMYLSYKCQFLAKFPLDTLYHTFVGRLRRPWRCFAAVA